MGHYASEMDGNWNRDPNRERLDAVDDPEIQELARQIYAGLNSASHWSASSDRAIKTANAIDDLIRARVNEALAGESTTTGDLR